MLSSLRMPLPRLSNEGDDPFSQYTKPPPHETDDEKSTRLRREAEEKRVNDEIDEYIKAEKAALKNLFSAIMTAPESTFKDQLSRLVQRYENGGVAESERSIQDLVLQLSTQFPGDIGVFCAFLLNHLSLNPGEAIFLAAGEPHAYVSGGAFGLTGVVTVP